MICHHCGKSSDDPVDLLAVAPDTRHREITSKWGALFKAEFDAEYSFIPKDAASLKRLLMTVDTSATTFLGLAAAAWRRSKEDRYATACRKAATLHGLCTFFNEIRVELQVPADGRKRGWNE